MRAPGGNGGEVAAERFYTHVLKGGALDFWSARLKADSAHVTGLHEVASTGEGLADQTMLVSRLRGWELCRSGCSML